MAGFTNTINDLLVSIVKDHNFPYFVETGTFKGKTAAFAANIFQNVYTIELSQNLFEDAQKKFKTVKNISCLHGNSSEVLEDLLPRLTGDTVFFLDAHWAGDLSAKADTDTPLLKELELLSKRKEYNDIIIIDDISFIGRKGSLPRPTPTQYYPNGGVYHYDWEHVTNEAVMAFFPNKKFAEKDDRLIIKN